MEFEQAVCFQHVQRGGENLWFSEDIKQQYEARLLCQKCPVQLACAVEAKKTQPTDGIWAGHSYFKEWNVGRKPKSTAAVQALEESNEL